MMTTNTTETPAELGFDDLYLNADTKQEVVALREDAGLLLSQQAESFCRQLVMLGRLPIDAYEIAYSVEETYRDEVLDVELKRWVKPDHANYLARRLMRNRDVIDYINVLRAQVLEHGKIERAEVIQSLKSITLDPDQKSSDRIAAATPSEQDRRLQQRAGHRTGWQPHNYHAMGAAATDIGAGHEGSSRRNA